MRILNYILPIALVGGVAFWAYRKLKNANPIVEKVVFNESKKPLSRSLVKKYSDDLYLAMKDLFTETDVLDSVYKEIELQSGAFVQIYNHFGRKGYWHFGSKPLDEGGGTPLDLVGWLRRELSGKRLKNWLDLAKKEGVL